MTIIARKQTVPVNIGGVTMGGGAPVVVQSMTNTDTADVGQTVAQVAALARAGSELVRITVDREEAAAAVPLIRAQLDKQGVDVPLIGDFHYNGHTLLAEYGECAEALAKYRINPGNVGFKDKRDKQFSQIIEIALKHSKPVRIGVNWGSLDQELLTRLMDENAQKPNPQDAREVMHEAIVQGSMERLVPILMTALTAALALIPIILKGERPGNEILAPLSVVILGGLLTSTFLNLVVVPAGYAAIHRLKQHTRTKQAEL